MVNEFKYQKDDEYRAWVIDNLLTTARNIYPTKGRFFPFDILYLPKAKYDKNGNDLNNKEHFMEVKARNFKHNKYDTTFVERDKYDKITASTETLGIPTELIILFEDGFLFYSHKDMFKEFDKYSKKYCPDQYDAYGDKWCMTNKEVAELKITNKNFHPYGTDKPNPFNSKTEDCGTSSQ